MRLLIRIAILLLLALIAYNYFLGTEDEQAESQQVVENARQLGQSLVDMVVSERERFSEGKYDEMRDRIGTSIGFLRERGEEFNISGKEFSALDEEKNELDSMIRQLDDMTKTGEESEQLEENIRTRIDRLIERMEQFIEE
ncbi:MAG: hypothetical protein EA411_13145 [Saprospirales bacterium]|nr:MAG: hypothetical protein EA411_13145 [Saprospirales bacterium]